MHQYRLGDKLTAPVEITVVTEIYLIWRHENRYGQSKSNTRTKWPFPTKSLFAFLDFTPLYNWPTPHRYLIIASGLTGNLTPHYLPIQI